MFFSDNNNCRLQRTKAIHLERVITKVNRQLSRLDGGIGRVYINSVEEILLSKSLLCRSYQGGIHLGSYIKNIKIYIRLTYYYNVFEFRRLCIGTSSCRGSSTANHRNRIHGNCEQYSPRRLYLGVI